MKNILCVGFAVALLSCCNFSDVDFKSSLDDSQSFSVQLSDEADLPGDTN